MLNVVVGMAVVWGTFSGRFAMKKDDFLSEFREIILLENYNQARDAVLLHLSKQVERKNKIEAQLAAATEKGMTSAAHDKEVSRLQWQLTAETHSIMSLLALIEASETALTVFRDKMLETLEMDVTKLEENRALHSRYQQLKSAWIESMQETHAAMTERNHLLFKINGI